MKKITLLCLAFVFGCSETESKCLGSTQDIPVERFECISPNAFTAMSRQGEVVEGDIALFNLYYLDQELTLHLNSSNYALVISSIDIAEPAILIGLKSSEYLMLDQISGDIINIKNGLGQSEFRIEFKDYYNIKINGKTFIK